MRCRARWKHRSLRLHTWSGTLSAGKALYECKVSGKDSPQHVVKVLSLKTYDRKVLVRGVLDTETRSVRFVGPHHIAWVPWRWQDEKPLLRSATKIPTYFTEVNFAQTSPSQLPDRVTVMVEIEAEDPYVPGVKRRLDDPNTPIMFILDVI
jgi:hypothetical protein